MNFSYSEHILVVSLEYSLSAPWRAASARVIKVERPDGGVFARSYDEAVKGQGTY